VTTCRGSRPPLILHTRCVTGMGGGPEKTILNSPRFLKRLGYDCLCAYLHPPADEGFSTLNRRAEAAGASLMGIPDHGPWDLDIVRKMARLCRRHNVAVWHGHDYKSNALGLLVRWFWPMKLVTTVHGWVQHTTRTPLYYAIDKLCLRHYDEVICVSKDLYAECLRVGVPSGRCHWVHNGIDADQFRRRGSAIEARQLFQEPLGKYVIGGMGRLSEEKGFEVLIRAVALLLKEGQDIELWIAGEGAQRRELQRLVNDLKQAERIKLLGHVNDIQAFYESLDVFALSSLREGLPNVLLEAMALEVPVVATRIAGVPFLVCDGENGILVEPGNVDVLAAALRRLVTSEQSRRILASAGRRRVEDSFSFERRMQTIARIYDRVLGRVSQSDPQETEKRASSHFNRGIASRAPGV
jgi:glycosyltransferase involved in cell wall biosynthesis